MAAVQQTGYALKYVNEKTDEICLAAVKQNCYALMYLKNQTDEICLAAVKKYGICMWHNGCWQSNQPS